MSGELPVERARARGAGEPAATGVPVVTVDGLTKEYRLYPSSGARVLEWLTGRPRHRVFRALSDVSFEQPQGAGIAIVGENGAGKSTLLKLLAGVSRPTSGRLDVRGRVSAILELGSGFHPEFSGRQNIRLSAALLGLTSDEIEAREPEIVAWSELGDFIDRPVREYSSGMSVRLAFSIATQVDPDLLIVDEALSVGDGYFQKKSMDRMVAFVERGGSLLFCSHSLYLVSAFCERAIWLRGGEVAAIGATRDVVRDYERYLATKRNRLEVVASNAGGPSPWVGTVGVEGPARIVSVTQTRTSEESPVYEPWAPFQLEVVFETVDPGRGFHVGALIHSEDDTVLSALGSRVCGHPPLTGRRRYRAQIDVPNLPYQKGLYHLSVLLLDEKALHVFDRREIRRAFAVTPKHWDPGQFGIGQRFVDLSGTLAGPALSAVRSSTPVDREEPGSVVGS